GHLLTLFTPEARRVCQYFFFQAEDGIRDFHVTGVQTCALPICGIRAIPGRPPGGPAVRWRFEAQSSRSIRRNEGLSGGCMHQLSLTTVLLLLIGFYGFSFFMTLRIGKKEECADGRSEEHTSELQ